VQKSATRGQDSEGARRLRSSYMAVPRLRNASDEKHRLGLTRFAWLWLSSPSLCSTTFRVAQSIGASPDDVERATKEADLCIRLAMPFMYRTYPNPCCSAAFEETQ
jgi:hypothetical protein